MYIFVSTLAAGALLTEVFGNVTTLPALADEGFYKGKFNMIVCSGAGGGFDYHGRMLARHMVKYIPGKPNMIVINLPGASNM